MARGNVVRISDFAPLAEDLAAAIDGFMSYCKSRNLSDNTLVYYRNRLLALSTFFNFLVNDGFLPGSPMANVDKPKRRKVVIYTFSLEQIEAILATCEKDFVGARDRALILMMLDCGQRVQLLYRNLLRQLHIRRLRQLLDAARSPMAGFPAHHA